MTIDQLINKLFFTLIIAVSSYGVQRVDRISSSMERLNEKIAIVIERVDNHETRLHDIEAFKRWGKEK